MSPTTRQNAVDDAKSFIAILNKDGVMIGADSDPDEAYAKAEHAAFAQGSPTGSVAVDSTVYSTPEVGPAIANPPNLGRASQVALTRSQIQTVKIPAADWMDFDPMGRDRRIVRDARAALRERGKELYGELLQQARALIHVRQKRGGVAAAFHDDWLTKDFLRQNMKMKKVLETEDSYDSIGLSLLPHGASFRPPFATATDQGPGGASYCSFSSAECRKVCLVNTGQRALESGAFASSYLFSILLREMPEQFFMNLFERCVLAYEGASKQDFYRFIRLNVLSDLPWELVAPGFLEAVCEYTRHRLLGRKGWRWTRGMALYDYTKIPYRAGVPGYYDLTMSFSGARNLFPALFDILDRKPGSAKRCAIVFVKREKDIVRQTGVRYRAAPGRPLMSGAQWLPWRFMKEDVWNGDLSDIRPLDPDEVKIIGLAYKVARYKVTPPRGSKKKFGLENIVPTADIDRDLPTFLVRVMQPDPEAPPFVVGTQDPDNRKLVLPIWRDED